MSKRKLNTILRTIFVAVSVANQFVCAVASLTDVIDNDTFKIVYNVISIILTGASTALAWWYNNSYTKEAEEADVYMDRLKELRKSKKTEEVDEDVYFIEEEGE